MYQKKKNQRFARPNLPHRFFNNLNVGELLKYNPLKRRGVKTSHRSRIFFPTRWTTPFHWYAYFFFSESTVLVSAFYVWAFVGLGWTPRH